MLNSSLAVLQRVKSASVTVDEKLVSSIGKGILVLAGVGKGDTEKDADSLINRILKARLWPDEGSGGQVSDGRQTPEYCDGNLTDLIS